MKTIFSILVLLALSLPIAAMVAPLPPPGLDANGRTIYMLQQEVKSLRSQNAFLQGKVDALTTQVAHQQDNLIVGIASMGLVGWAAATGLFLREKFPKTPKSPSDPIPQEG